MKSKFTFFFAVALLATSGFTALAPAPAFADPFTVQTERAAHPRLVHAIDAMTHAYKELQAAPDDFGGNKAQAMQDLKQGIHSLKKALYYRLNMDDAALDRIP